MAVVSGLHAKRDQITRLLHEAAECGATVVSGLEMFIRQTMGQFEHFTGMPGTSFLPSFLLRLLFKRWSLTHFLYDSPIQLQIG